MPRRSSPVSKRTAHHPYILEGLEQRYLLTTLHAGDIFEFSDVDGNYVRIVVDQANPAAPGGDTTAEFVGASLGESGQTILHDLPGTLNGTPVLGGIGGADGIELIGGTPITDPITGQNVPFDPIGVADINIQALAADAQGNTYGFNVLTRTVNGTSVNLVQLLKFDTSTGAATAVAELSNAIINDPLNEFDAPLGAVAVTVKSVEAADFNPVDGLLYFVAAGGASTIPQLYTVDVNAGNATDIAASVTGIQGTFGAQPAIPATLNTPAVPAVPVVVRSIVFDQTSANTVILNAYAHVDIQVASAGGQFFTTETIGQIFTVDPTNANTISNRVRTKLNGVDILNITGIEYCPDDPSAAEQFVLAVTSATAGSGPTPSLLEINRSSGAAFILGPLPDPNDLDAPVRGNDLEGITFVPNLIDPLTGELGTLVATDATSDELVRVSCGNRFPLTDLFAVYVTQSDENSMISVAEFPKPSENAGNLMRPFQFSIGQLAISPLDSTPPTIFAPANSGRAYLGLRTSSSEATPPFGADPITSGAVTTPLGVLPLSITSLTAGLTVANGNDFGRFLFGGTVTGQVDFTGSADLFYAGWLLTGVTQGQGDGTPDNPGNFQVGGDLRDLVVKGPIGTDKIDGSTITHYSSGFDLEVGGKLGEVRTLDAFLGQANITHDVNAPRFTSAYQEFEAFGPAGPEFQAGFLSDPDFTNNTFDTPEYLGTINGDNLGTQIAQVDGEIAGTGDTSDFYALGLMSSQTITVGVLGGGVGLNVYDPDNRLFASDNSNVDFGVTNEHEFQFKTDRPGAYRFEVVGIGTYELTIRNTGDVALGGVFAKGDIYHAVDGASFTVQHGDLGQINSAASMYFGRSPAHDIVVPNGNIRSTEGADLGISSGPGYTGLGLFAATGGIGLIRAVSGDANLDLVDLNLNLETIDVAGDLYVNMRTNQGLGVIRAGSMSSFNGLVEPFDSVLGADVITVNADNTGFDGNIDLIDVTGDFGSSAGFDTNGHLEGGGPHITTNAGGNVRYIHVGGLVFRDELFGISDTGGDEQTTQPGEVLTLNDDSGAKITLTPTGDITRPNPNFNSAEAISDSNPLFVSDVQLRYTTYPIRGSGGVVLIKVVAEPSTTTAPGDDTTTTGTGAGSSGDASVNVSVNGIGGSSSGDIAELDVAGSGAADIVTDGANSTTPPTVVIDPASTANLSLNLSGNAPLNVFHIQGNDFNQIVNSTDGELVSINATSIGLLQAETLGLAKSTTGAAVEGNTVISSALPFKNLKNGIVAANIAQARSRRGLGNFDVSGDIGQLRPNYDGKDVPGVFEGINGPIFAGGDLVDINIGEGLLPSGSGEFFLSGLYSNGTIWNVTNQGLGSDIRGDIISTIAHGIRNITLNDGAIINADIMVTDDFTSGFEQPTGLISPDDNDSVNNPIFDIENVTVNGRGGIIGTFFAAADIGNVHVSGGFGILNSRFMILSDGVIKSIQASGYGIRSTSILSGSVLRELIATGNGGNIPTSNFTASVRESETNQFDPFFGNTINTLTDLHAFLGTSAVSPSIPGVTDTGVIEDVNAKGQGTLNKVRAVTIRERATREAPVAGEEFAMQFNFASSIKSIRTTGIIDGLNIVSGKLKEFMPTGDVSRLGINISGRISTLKFPGSVSDNSFIRAFGPDGRIDKLQVKGNLDGNVSATGRIKQLIVGGSINGGVNIDGLSQAKKIVDELRIGGVLTNGAVALNGNVGKIKTGSLGNIGDVLTVNGNLDTLQVHGNLFSNVVIHGNLKKATIGGAFVSGATMHVDLILKSISIGTDFQAGAVIEAGEVRKKKVKGLDLGTVVII